MAPHPAVFGRRFPCVDASVFYALRRRRRDCSSLPPLKARPGNPSRPSSRLRRSAHRRRQRNQKMNHWPIFAYLLPTLGSLCALSSPHPFLPLLISLSPQTKAVHHVRYHSLPPCHPRLGPPRRYREHQPPPPFFDIDDGDGEKKREKHGQTASLDFFFFSAHVVAVAAQRFTGTPCVPSANILRSAPPPPSLARSATTRRSRAP